MAIDRLTPPPAPGFTQRLIIVAGVLMGFAIVGALHWWEGRSATQAPATASGATVSSTATPQSAWSASEATGTRGAPAATDATARTGLDAGFRKYVADKYRFLTQTSAALQTALLEREQLAVAINTARQGTDYPARDAIPTQQAALADVDRKIGSLLRPADLAAYEALKDSDIEQFQLEDYAGGIANVAPLRDADKQAILYTKLAYRQRFRQTLNDSGLLRGDLRAVERQIVLADVGRALKDSRDGFLQEVRQYLYDDAQYSLLSNYENSEYEAELAKLRTIAYGE